MLVETTLKAPWPLKPRLTVFTLKRSQDHTF